MAEVVTGSLVIQQPDPGYALLQFSDAVRVAMNIGVAYGELGKPAILDVFSDTGAWQRIFQIDRATGAVSHGGGRLRPSNFFDGLDARESGVIPGSTLDQTAAFNAWRSAISGVQSGVIPRGTFRLSESFDWTGLDVELKAGARVKNPSGGNYYSNLPGFEGDAGFGIFEIEKAFGPGGWATRLRSPSASHIVDAGELAANGGSAATFVSQRVYQGKSTPDSYKVINNFETQVHYGLGMPPGQRASGSMRTAGDVMYVWKADNGTSGVTEVQGSLTALKALGHNEGADIANGLNFWGQELTVSGKTGPLNDGSYYDKYLMGSTIMVQKRSAGRANNAPYVVSGGLSIATSPHSTGFDGPEMNAYGTYPLDCMIALGGFTGPNGTRTYVDGGYDAAATAAAFYAIRIGSTRTTIWGDTNWRSKFGMGIYIDDCTDAGVYVTAGHLRRLANYKAIHAAINTKTLLGSDTFESGGGNGSLALEVGAGGANNGMNIYLQETTHSTSRCSGIRFGNMFNLRTDMFLDGAANIGFYNASTGRWPIAVSAGDKVTIFNLKFGTTFTPAGSGDGSGETNEIVADSNYIYVKTAAGWKRAALTGF